MLPREFSESNDDLWNGSERVPNVGRCITTLAARPSRPRRGPSQAAGQLPSQVCGRQPAAGGSRIGTRCAGRLWRGISDTPSGYRFGTLFALVAAFPQAWEQKPDGFQRFS